MPSGYGSRASRGTTKAESGGTIALACWPPEGFIGDSIRSFKSTTRTLVFRYPSAEANFEFFRTYYGPTLKLFPSVGEAGATQLATELADLARRYDHNQSPHSPVAIAADYLESVMIKA